MQIIRYFNNFETIDCTKPLSFIVIYSTNDLVIYFIDKGCFFYKNSYYSLTGLINQNNTNNILFIDYYVLSNKKEFVDLPDIIRSQYILTLPHFIRVTRVKSNILVKDLVNNTYKKISNIELDKIYCLPSHEKYLSKYELKSYKNDTKQSINNIKVFIHHMKKFYDKYIIKWYDNSCDIYIYLGDLKVQLVDSNSYREVKDFFIRITIYDGKIHPIEAGVCYHDIDQIISHNIHAHMKCDTNSKNGRLYSYCFGTGYFKALESIVCTKEFLSNIKYQTDTLEYYFLSFKHFFSTESSAGGPHHSFNSYMSTLNRFFNNLSSNNMYTSEFITNFISRFHDKFKFDIVYKRDYSYPELIDIDASKEEILSFINEYYNPKSIVIGNNKFITNLSKDQIILALKSKAKNHKNESSDKRYCRRFTKRRKLNIKGFVEKNYFDSSNITYFNKKSIIDIINNLIIYGKT